jgi:GntR family transcriptional repressor for pyruvate dehydrogenase complex
MFNVVNKSEKISDNIIEQIRDKILRGQVKTGDNLGTEKELASKFGVSNATMREALRVLEVLGFIVIKKGINGGAFVAEVELKTTINSIMNFLHFQTLSIKEITMVRYFLEPPLGRIAAAKITDNDIRNLKRYLAGPVTYDQHELLKEAAFHHYLVTIAENPILSLLIDLVDNLLVKSKVHLRLGYEFYENVRQAHVTIFNCLVERDGKAAEVAIADDLLEVGNYIAELTNTPAFDPSEFF